MTGRLWHPSDLGEFFDTLRSSEVSTCPRQLATASTQLSSVNQYAGKAIARTAGTYTKIRFATGGAGAGVTNMRAGVWNMAGTLLAQSADLSGSFAQNTLFDNKALDNSVILAAGDLVWLGVGSVATTSIQFRCASVGSAAIWALTPVLNINKAVALTAGSSLGDMTSPSSSGGCPWVELIP